MSISWVQASMTTERMSPPTSFFFMRGCSKTSCHDILLFSSTTRLRVRKSLVFCPILALKGKLTGLWQMPLRYSSMLLQGHGGQPKIISQSIRPKLQISDLAVYGSFRRSWGAMQMGVPQMSFSFFLPRMSALQAKPKSATLQWWFFTKVFAGFMSRWMYPLPTKTLNPCMISSKAATHSGSVNLRDASSLRRSVSQSSRMMYVYLLPILASIILTVCSELTSMVMSISPLREAMSVGSLLNSSIRIFFIAQNWPSSVFFALNTFPQLPSPRKMRPFQSNLLLKGNQSSDSIQDISVYYHSKKRTDLLLNCETHRILSKKANRAEAEGFLPLGEKGRTIWCMIGVCSKCVIAISYMNLDIFDSTRHWSYSADDQLAEIDFSLLEKQARESLPKGFFDRSALLNLQFMKETQLYRSLKTLPKGVLHNVFFECCEDTDFYRRHVITDPNVYVTEDFDSFRIGTREEAERYNWVSMEAARKMYKREEDFLAAISKIALFDSDELKTVCEGKGKEAWALYEQKVLNSSVIIYARHLFGHYVRHVLRKFIRNGYQRVEFRAELLKLSLYDSHGKFISKMPQSEFAAAFDEAFADIEKEHPHFSVGFIFYLRKSLSEGEIEAELSRICELGWGRTVGIDFVEEEDRYGSLQKYDKIVEKVMGNYPTVRLWKVYHAGQTKNHLSRNIEEAVVAGSVRIGHGLNILQRVEFLPFCKHVCFEKCPISNLLLGYTGDPRESSAPILLGLGYAVSINMGDAGKFGVEDGTADLFVSSVSYDWTLKHLKLVALHSINHALCKDRHRRQMLKKFDEGWSRWVTQFLHGSHRDNRTPVRRLDIFTSTNNWKYSCQDQLAEEKFEEVRRREINRLPEDFFHKTTLTHLQHIRSSELYEFLKDIPKGVLHHDHFDCNEDEDFYRECIMTDPNVYLAADRKSFKIGPVQEAQKEGWISFQQLCKQMPNQRKAVKFVSNLTMLQKEELQVVSGNQHDFWVLFEQKIGNFFVLVFALHIFKKYVRHVLLKYIKNGYQRVEFRALLCKLNQYDQKGNFVKTHDEGMYMQAFDEVYFQVLKQHPHFSAAFIFFGLKALTEEKNFEMLDKACSYEWPRMVGIDFVQQQDPYGSMEPYIRVGDRIVKKWAHLQLKKVYHAGETKDHLNSNVELSVRSGSVRIGHGLNIVKRIEYLNQCRHICFELNPISNLLTGGMTDIRMSTAPLLLGLGYAVSISSDDPGKFGYEDTTVDYFASAVSFNWTLRHLKLIAYHSINHAIVTEGQRLQILECFEARWNSWVNRFLERELREGAEWPKRNATPYDEESKYEENHKRRVPIFATRINSVTE